MAAMRTGNGMRLENLSGVTVVGNANVLVNCHRCVVTGNGGTISGSGNRITGNGHRVNGNGNDVSGNANTIVGNRNTVFGNGNRLTGDDNRADGNGNRLTGSGNSASGNGNRLTGSGNSASGNGNRIDNQYRREEQQQQASSWASTMRSSLFNAFASGGSTSNISHRTIGGNVSIVNGVVRIDGVRVGPDFSSSNTAGAAGATNGASASRQGGRNGAHASAHGGGGGSGGGGDSHATNTAQRRPVPIYVDDDSDGESDEDVVVNVESSSSSGSSSSGASTLRDALARLPDDAGDTSCDDEALSCVVCLDRRRNVVLMPCKHMVLCVTCTRSHFVASDKCPSCRATATDLHHVFL